MTVEACCAAGCQIKAEGASPLSSAAHEKHLALWSRYQRCGRLIFVPAARAAMRSAA